MSENPEPDPGQTDGGPRHGRRVLIIWAVLSVVGVALVFVLGSVVNSAPGSSDAVFAKLTNVLFTALGVPVALFVWVYVGYSVIVFRERSPAANVEELVDGPPLQAKPRQQVAWLAITGGLAIFLVGWGMFGFYKQLANPPVRPLVIRVVGQQWTWTYSYPSLGVQSNELYLPVNRPVQFRITSDDVLHGFAIDGMAVTMDANPGWWVTAPTVTPTKLGDYTVRCVELCGLYHTYMWSPVRVVSGSTFATWVAANAGGAHAAGS
jgi:cytochrome c oxidase subunit II